MSLFLQKIKIIDFPWCSVCLMAMAPSLIKFCQLKRDLKIFIRTGWSDLLFPTRSRIWWMHHVTQWLWHAFWKNQKVLQRVSLQKRQGSNKYIKIILMTSCEHFATNSGFSVVGEGVRRSLLQYRLRTWETVSRSVDRGLTATVTNQPSVSTH